MPTVSRMAWAVMIAVGLGIALGLAMGLWRRLRESLELVFAIV